MKKSTKICIISIVAVLAALVIGIQIMVLNDENTTYNAKPLIVCALVLAVGAVLGLTASVVVNLKYIKKAKKVFDAFSDRNYEYVLANKDVCSKIKNAKIQAQLYMAIGVSYLETGNNEECLAYLDMIRDKETERYKYFWKAVLAISINDVEQFENYRALLKNCASEDDKGYQILQLIEKHKIENCALTEDEKAFVDGLNSNKIKSILG